MNHEDHEDAPSWCFVPFVLNRVTNCAGVSGVASSSPMADKSYSDDELKALRTSPGWQLDADDAKHEGTLEDVAKIAHERHARGEHPGLIKEVENSIELDMLKLEALWRAMGLPV